MPPKKRKMKGEGLSDIFGGIRKTASPAIRKFTAENGDAKITKIVVCRQPVTPAVEKAASWLSLGKWDANKKKLQYDKMLHLFMIMTLNNGKTIKFEKNHVPEISYNTATGSDTMETAPPNIAWKDMIVGAEKAAGGPEKLWVYDAITQNCQYFVKAVLTACRVLTPALEKFVMQDAAKVIEGLSWFQKLARKLTDTANLADVAVNGRGKGGEKKAVMCGCGARLIRITAAHKATDRHKAGMRARRRRA